MSYLILVGKKAQTIYSSANTCTNTVLTDSGKFRGFNFWSYESQSTPKAELNCILFYFLNNQNNYEMTLK